ncbi:fumarylacetoacetate hydrolase family protein [Galbitalea sp. SE-J8]|uniref:fumarylacetoacetate hydrolase family protein n=1 Tax=Galbitalea sp. SE-J8 TaxID=3054952 RepID=UPI00259C6AA9|nr:fumarylacetoacetate hydrolase family protein [Galbitalea sp. SE-J8]MDM4762157.1 fumarylacetoacetate hydrolase family protein [Galbitalea sp. SE-J8]
MKVARFVQEGQPPRYGIIDGDELVVLKGDPLFAGFDTLDERVPLADASLVAPVIPRSKLIGFVPGVPDEDDPDAAVDPVMYLEPNTAVVGPGDSVRVPDGIGTVEAFGALAIVIGSLARDVRPGDAAQVVFGYTVANDVTATDLARADGQWARAKSYDSFTPLGPVIETELDSETVEVIVDIDGDEKRRGTLSTDIATAIEQASAVATLLPGDVILIPLLDGVELDEGVTVEVTIPTIGTLRSDIRAR